MAMAMVSNGGNKKATRLAACTLALVGFGYEVEAEEWTIVPRVNVEETFSDNVGPTSPDSVARSQMRARQAAAHRPFFAARKATAPASALISDELMP